MARGAPRVRALDAAENSTRDRMLQVTERAEVSQNGNGMDHRQGRNHAVWTLPKNRADVNSSSLSPERKDETNEGDGGVLSLGEDGNGHGVTRRRLRSGQLVRWVTASRVANGGGKARRARGAELLPAPARGRRRRCV